MRSHIFVATLCRQPLSTNSQFDKVDDKGYDEVFF